MNIFDFFLLNAKFTLSKSFQKIPSNNIKSKDFSSILQTLLQPKDSEIKFGSSKSYMKKRYFFTPLQNKNVKGIHDILKQENHKNINTENSLLKDKNFGKNSFQNTKKIEFIPKNLQQSPDYKFSDNRNGDRVKNELNLFLQTYLSVPKKFTVLSIKKSRITKYQPLSEEVLTTVKKTKIKKQSKQIQNYQVKQLKRIEKAKNIIVARNLQHQVQIQKTDIKLSKVNKIIKLKKDKVFGNGFFVETKKVVINKEKESQYRTSYKRLNKVEHDKNNKRNDYKKNTKLTFNNDYFAPHNIEQIHGNIEVSVNVVDNNSVNKKTENLQKEQKEFLETKLQFMYKQKKYVIREEKENKEIVNKHKINEQSNIVAKEQLSSSIKSKNEEKMKMNKQEKIFEKQTLQEDYKKIAQYQKIVPAKKDFQRHNFIDNQTHTISRIKTQDTNFMQQSIFSPKIVNINEKPVKSAFTQINRLHNTLKKTQFLKNSEVKQQIIQNSNLKERQYSLNEKVRESVEDNSYLQDAQKRASSSIQSQELSGQWHELSYNNDNIQEKTPEKNSLHTIYNSDEKFNIPQTHKRMISFKLDQTLINVNLQQHRLLLYFSSQASVQVHPEIEQFISEVMQDNGYDSYKVIVKDREKKVTFSSKEKYKNRSIISSTINVKI